MKINMCNIYNCTRGQWERHGNQNAKMKNEKKHSEGNDSKQAGHLPKRQKTENDNFDNLSSFSTMANVSAKKERGQSSLISCTSCHGGVCEGWALDRFHWLYRQGKHNNNFHNLSSFSKLKYWKCNERMETIT